MKHLGLLQIMERRFSCFSEQNLMIIKGFEKAVNILTRQTSSHSQEILKHLLMFVTSNQVVHAKV